MTSATASAFCAAASCALVLLVSTPTVTVNLSGCVLVVAVPEVVSVALPPSQLAEVTLPSTQCTKEGSVAQSMSSALVTGICKPSVSVWLPLSCAVAFCGAISWPAAKTAAKSPAASIPASRIFWFLVGVILPSDISVGDIRSAS